MKNTRSNTKSRRKTSKPKEEEVSEKTEEPVVEKEPAILNQLSLWKKKLQLLKDDAVEEEAETEEALWKKQNRLLKMLKQSQNQILARYGTLLLSQSFYLVL